MHQHARQPNHEQRDSTLSGKVLVSGAGFLVTSAAWGLLGFFRLQQGDLLVVALDVFLVVTHLLVGIAILKRLRRAWHLGLALAVAGLIATPANDYYVPAIADGVSGLLLFLSRLEFSSMPATREREDR